MSQSDGHCDGGSVGGGGSGAEAWCLVTAIVKVTALGTMLAMT